MDKNKQTLNPYHAKNLARYEAALDLSPGQRIIGAEPMTWKGEDYMEFTVEERGAYRIYRVYL